MSTIVINNNSYSGNNIVIKNGRVIVDGKDVTPEGKEINIVVEGNIEKLSVDACDKLSVNGNVGSIETKSGDVDVTGNVNGNIQTMSGDVDCGDITGSIKTMSGDIKHRKS